MGQFSITSESEQVRFATSLRSSSVMDRGTTWPRASMLCMAMPISVLRSISLSISWLQSTAWQFGAIFASNGTRFSVPLQGRPSTSVSEGITFSQTFDQVFSTSWFSRPSAVFVTSPVWALSTSARLHGIRVRFGSRLSMSCISRPKKAAVLSSTSVASMLLGTSAARSAASARVKSRSSGFDTDGTRSSMNCACFRLCGKSQMTKFCTPSAMSR
mmetsp:Transcript_66682/g.171706  ORF Transcript_66682/g.171706 Transcript_66682/m.171706 type:complete len:215 (+) Transcript_66682:1508-2152(+)